MDINEAWVSSGANDKGDGTYNKFGFDAPEEAQAFRMGIEYINTDHTISVGPITRHPGIGSKFMVKVFHKEIGCLVLKVEEA